MDQPNLAYVINELENILNESELINILAYYYLEITNHCYLDVSDEFRDYYNLIHILVPLKTYGVKICIQSGIIRYASGIGIAGYDTKFHLKFKYNYTPPINLINIKELIKIWCEKTIKNITNILAAKKLSHKVERAIMNDLERIIGEIDEWDLNVIYE